MPATGCCATTTSHHDSGSNSRRAYYARANHAHAEDRAIIAIIAIGPALNGCPVEEPVGGLHQTAPGRTAISAVEAVQRRKHALHSFDGTDGSAPWGGLV